MREVPTSHLRSEMVPRFDPTSPEGAHAVFVEFALSFPGYEKVPDLGRKANEVLAQWQATDSLPDSAEMIRGCLFFEQRRHNHYGLPIGPDDMPYLNALLDRLRSMLPNASRHD